MTGSKRESIWSSFAAVFVCAVILSGVRPGGLARAVSSTAGTQTTSQSAASPTVQSGSATTATAESGRATGRFENYDFGFGA
jgi:hypothetical protein